MVKSAGVFQRSWSTHVIRRVHDILFVAPLTQSAAYYDGIVREWAIGNYARVALILVSVVLLTVSLIRIARDTATAEHRLS